MRDPLSSLKLLPWSSLLQVSVLTTLIVVIVELLVGLGLKYSSIVETTLNFIYSGSTGVFMNFLVAACVGVLAVYLLERFYPQVRINAGVLWALIPCVALVIAFKLLFPLPAILMNFKQNPNQLMGLPIGIFWQGQRYWWR
ncbi:MULTISPECIES: peptide chain release factor 1 [Aerosakkonema]|uniref:peptide chain release factor 1 n=1 Tax=Aerosakkonema TaxID=1246629 RepID=UPI0035B98104